MDCICHDGTNFGMVDNYNNEGRIFKYQFSITMREEYSNLNSPIKGKQVVKYVFNIYLAKRKKSKCYAIRVKVFTGRYSKKIP